MNRRNAFKILTGTGIGSLVFQRYLAAQIAGGVEISPAMLSEAEWVAGIALTESERESLSRTLTRTQRELAELRELPLDYRTSPALVFSPKKRDDENITPAQAPAVTAGTEPVQRPDSDEDLAFLPVTTLAQLVRGRLVTSTELTRLYIERLKRFDPILNCVVTYTEDLALEQAARADAEIAAGKYRGPLHGIPWGAKDLVAYPGYRTTWGAAHYKNQKLGHKATVADKLDAAGAVLVAKLTLGALAEGDQWFGGRTNNPFFPDQGSSGSSAGSAAAVSAGLVGFAIGSETLGSIVSPCKRCRATGLRPTFGRVSRYGCMPLSWTMDKLGPIARSVDDCAIVFAAIHGADGRDPSAVTRAFQWPSGVQLESLKIGYVEGEDSGVLDTLRELGVSLVPFELPGRDLARKLSYILSVEAAAAFDEVAAQGITEAFGFNNWKERFRRMRFVPAIDYIRANRLRSQLMDEVAHATEDVDAWVGGDDLVVTNLTGHPTVVMPHGEWSIETDENGEEKSLRSRSITFSGQPYADEALLVLASAFQRTGRGHLMPPPLE